MAWIETLDADAVEPRSRLGRLYKAAVDPETGHLDNIITIHALRPDTLDAHLRMWGATCRPRHGQGLGRREREMIGIAVSAHNHCHY